MTDSELFDATLTSHQTDLKRIIGKYRGDTHKLSHDELLSEINVYLLKKKEDIINYRDEENGVTCFTETGFKKAAYSYARNLIKWTHIRQSNISYVKRRVDHVHTTEDGEVTTFELLCDTMGTEAIQLDFDRSAKSQYIIKVLTQYNNFLTPNDLNILELMYEGLNQYQIAQKLGVTHQAISLAVIKLTEKIKNNLKFDYKTDDSSAKVTRGRKAIKALFGPRDDRSIFTPEDGKKLRKFLKSNYKRYTLAELVESYEGGRFTPHQIMGAINFKGYGGHLRKRTPPKTPNRYTDAEAAILIEMAEAGKFYDEIGKVLKRNNKSLAAKCISLAREGRLDVFPKKRFPKKLSSYSDADVEQIIALANKGKPVDEIAVSLDRSSRQISAKCCSLVRQGVLSSHPSKGVVAPA